MMRSLLPILALLAAAVAAVMAGAPAVGADLHRLWEARCARCHGEAGDFARQGLGAQRDLPAFLACHRGGLPEAEARGVAAMLLAQAGTPPLFRERCGLCHPKAADLARDALVVRDGVLVGRYTGRRIDAFLAGHGRIGADERPFFVELLTRLAHEVDRAP